MSLRHQLDDFLHRFEQDFAVHNAVLVSRAALLHNFDQFAARDLQIMPVLKGNAYGHGIRQVAAALTARAFPYIAVDGYFEALQVQQVSRQPILVMGAVLPQNFAHMNFKNTAFVVQDVTAIKALGATRRPVKVHLEVNTGMNRYGCNVADVPAHTKLIMSYKNLQLQGIMSHLADADGTDPQTVQQAVQRFDESVEAMRAAGGNPTLMHAAQTAGSVVARSRYANAMRLGIGLYGVNPFVPNHPNYNTLANLQPTLRLTSTITKVTQLQPGDKVSYNYTFTAPKVMRIAVLPVGYYEGMPRALSNVGVVKIGQKFAPIVGRVCMNHTIISLDGIDASVGDQAVILSDQPGDANTIQALAERHNLFAYSLLTGINATIRRQLT